MNRKRVVIAGGIVSATVLIYCLSFGPFMYAESLATRHGYWPSWIRPWQNAAFRPHLWVMYQSESYYSYIIWFAKLGGRSLVGDWGNYRSNYERHFKIGR